MFFFFKITETLPFTKYRIDKTCLYVTTIYHHKLSCRTFFFIEKKSQETGVAHVVCACDCVRVCAVSVASCLCIVGGLFFVRCFSVQQGF